MKHGKFEAETELYYFSFLGLYGRTDRHHLTFSYIILSCLEKSVILITCFLLASGDGESAETKALKEQVSNLEKELASANKNVESMKSQSESLAQEYDRWK